MIDRLCRQAEEKGFKEGYEKALRDETMIPKITTLCGIETKYWLDLKDALAKRNINIEDSVRRLNEEWPV